MRSLKLLSLLLSWWWWLRESDVDCVGEERRVRLEGGHSQEREPVRVFVEERDYKARAKSRLLPVCSWTECVRRVSRAKKGMLSMEVDSEDRQPTSEKRMRMSIPGAVHTVRQNFSLSFRRVVVRQVREERRERPEKVAHLVENRSGVLCLGDPLAPLGARNRPLWRDEFGPVLAPRFEVVLRLLGRQVLGHKNVGHSGGRDRSAGGEA